MALKYIEKLGKIIEGSSKNDIEPFMERINVLWWDMVEKLGWFDNLGHIDETKKDWLEKKIESGSKLADSVAYYICRKCGRKGYLFSPNLDENKLELYMLHIIWKEKKAEFCYLGKTKPNLLLIATSPTEGILKFF